MTGFIGLFINFDGTRFFCLDDSCVEFKANRSFRRDGKQTLALNPLPVLLLPDSFHQLSDSHLSSLQTLKSLCSIFFIIRDNLLEEFRNIKGRLLHLRIAHGKEFNIYALILQVLCFLLCCFFFTCTFRLFLVSEKENSLVESVFLDFSELCEDYLESFSKAGSLGLSLFVCEVLNFASEDKLMDLVHFFDLLSIWCL